jgi:hypothetical protein
MIRWAGLIALLVLPLTSLAAQSNEAARTTIGISIGLLPAASLWDVPNQIITPISPSPIGGAPWDPDIWSLRREVIARRPVLQMRGTRFVNPRVGFTAEFAYYALSTVDHCTVVQHGRVGNAANADPALPQVCDSIPVTPQGSRSTLALQGGVVLRPFSGATIQPFVEGLAGFASAASSMAELRSDFAGTSLTIYHDLASSNVHPTFALGGGFTTGVVPGLLARVAARESWISESIVTGASQGQATPALIQARYIGFFAVTVGFDIVLAKQRGKRY